jgi:3-oxoacyl-(acyl-carrier-protein) synthase
MHRVVITGIGVVSPAGMTLDEYWPALVNAHCAIGFIKNIPTERLNTRLAAQVLNFETRTSFTDKQAGQVDRFAQFAVVSAQAAVKDSNIQISEEGALTTAVVVGNSAGGQNTFDDAYLKLYGHNSPRLHSADDTSRDVECGGEPCLDSSWFEGTRLDGLDGLRVRDARDRTGFSYDP